MKKTLVIELLKNIANLVGGNYEIITLQLSQDSFFELSDLLRGDEGVFYSGMTDVSLKGKAYNVIHFCQTQFKIEIKND